MLRTMTQKERVLLIAAKSAVDPRTVEKMLRGETIRASVKERIELAMREVDGDSRSSVGR